MIAGGTITGGAVTAIDFSYSNMGAAGGGAATAASDIDVTLSEAADRVTLGSDVAPSIDQVFSDVVEILGHFTAESTGPAFAGVSLAARAERTGAAFFRVALSDGVSGAPLLGPIAVSGLGFWGRFLGYLPCRSRTVPLCLPAMPSHLSGMCTEKPWSRAAPPPSRVST